MLISKSVLCSSKAYSLDDVAQLYAIKTIEAMKTKLNKRAFEIEVSALGQLSHPNIVALVEVVQRRSLSYVVMEYCAGGDLRSLLDYFIDSRWVNSAHLES